MKQINYLNIIIYIYIQNKFKFKIEIYLYKRLLFQAFNVLDKSKIFNILLHSNKVLALIDF
jgi:hypothetical protein